MKPLELSQCERVTEILRHLFNMLAGYSQHIHLALKELYRYNGEQHIWKSLNLFGVTSNPTIRAESVSGSLWYITLKLKWLLIKYFSSLLYIRKWMHIILQILRAIRAINNSNFSLLPLSLPLHNFLWTQRGNHARKLLTDSHPSFV